MINENTVTVLNQGGEIAAPDPYDRISTAISVAETFNDLSGVNNQIEALRMAARRQQVTLEDQNKLARLHIMWTQKVGEMRAAIPKASGERTDLTSADDQRRLGKADADKEIGINKNTGQTAQKVAEIPKAEVEAYVEETEAQGKEVTLSGLLSSQKKKKKQKDLAKAKAKFKEKDAGAEKPIIHKMDALDFIDTFEDGSVDLLLTDPPYSTDVDDIYGFAESWAAEALRKVKPTGRAFICIGAYPAELHAYLGVLLEVDGFIVDAPLIWTYRNTLGQTPKHKYNLNYQVILHVYTEQSNKLDTSITNEMFSVQDINAPDGRQGDRVHTWQKPDELAERLIRHTTKEGDLVIDPFTCTGTFILAANRLGRVGIGSDINDDNIAIGVSRGCSLG